jgi:sugar lactone lactonase YvrE
MPRSFALLGTAALCSVLFIAACDMTPGVPDALVAPEDPALAMTFPPPVPERLAQGLLGASGSTIGPDGALYVTQGAIGEVSRVDPITGAVTPFATGLPMQTPLGVGGAMDVVFHGGTAYVLVTAVDDPFFDIIGLPRTGAVNGLYRIDGPTSHTVVADIGAYNLAHPRGPDIQVLFGTGILYALETFRGDILVSDGHLNRVLKIGRSGGIEVFKEFGNIVPTGLETHGNTLLMAEAGPTPHLPADGKVAAIDAGSGAVAEVASGARLAVDVELGLGQTLFVLSQGFWDDQNPNNMDGSPADPGTGALFRVDGDGGVTELVDGLNIPTSMELVGNTAYVVTLLGEVWKIDGVAAPPYGRR